MNFEFTRSRVQKRLEEAVGCFNYTELQKYKEQIESYSISETERELFLEDLHLDAKDIYFKSITSFLESLNNILNNRQSWAIVKLYYSIYFLARCSLAMDNFAYIKGGTRKVYLLNIDGNQPVKTYHSEKGSDHEKILYFYGTRISDKTFVNNLIEFDGENIFLWEYLKKFRERVHYQEILFHEPNMQYISRYAHNEPINNWLDTYLNDYLKKEYKYGFDPDHALIAFPVYFFQKVKEQMNEKGISNFFTEKQQEFIKELYNELPVIAKIIP